MAKNMHCLSSVLLEFYQISRFVWFGFFPATEKWKFGSLCRVFGSVRFGSMRVLKWTFIKSCRSSWIKIL